MSIPFLQELAGERASAILRTDDADIAGQAMDAAVKGGFRIVEFTLTTPGALDLVSEFAKREGLVVGAGTVLTSEEAAAAVSAGARFIVSPVVDEAVIGASLDLGAVPIPGTHTPTEMLRAWRAGAPLQKLFPAPAGGPVAVKACLGPMPFLRLVPTHGVDEKNVGEFLAAGAFAVGFVAPLFAPELLADGDLSAIEARARTLLSAVRACH